MENLADAIICGFLVHLKGKASKMPAFPGCLTPSACAKCLRCVLASLHVYVKRIDRSCIIEALCNLPAGLEVIVSFNR